MKTKINLKTKSLSIGKKKIIENGEIVSSYELDNTPVTISELENLYELYKHSIPDKENDRKREFKALPFEKLSYNDLLTSKPRSFALNDLKLKILTGVLNKSLTWDMFTTNPKHFFWVSPNDSDFIIFKEWIS